MRSRRRAALTTGSLVVLLGSLALPGRALASPMLIEWSARIGFVTTNPIPQLPPGVELGDIISGTFLYDTDSAPTTVFSTGALYQVAGAWTLTIGGRTYSGAGLEGHVLNDHPVLGDELAFATTPSTNDPDFQFSYRFSVRDLDGGKWGSTALPGAFTADGFDGSSIVVRRHDTSFINIFGEPEVGEIDILSANTPNRLTSLRVTPVPEPSTLLLLGGALPAVAAMRRRRNARRGRT